MSTLSKVTSPAIPSERIGRDFTRADIAFEDLDHAGSTYEGRVFVNNPGAGPDTDRSPDTGYAGSYYVFGHGGCYGDVGHCDVRPRAASDPRPPHALWPTRRVVIATGAIREAVGKADSVTVTVVPVVLSTTDKVSPDETIPRFGSVSVITYQ